MPERAVGLGLRAQIALILAMLFSLSAAALFALSLQREAGSARRVAQARADTLALGADALYAAEGPGALDPSLGQLLAEGAVVGARVEQRGLPPRVLGLDAGSVSAATSPSGRLRIALYTDPKATLYARPWLRVLLSYVALTSVLAVLLASAALRRLIVAPVANLTAAAQALEGGALHTRVPVAGAREVAQLGVSFNRMARKLSDDRNALADKVQALERATAELTRAQDQLVRSEKLASVGRLAAGLAHEIGNPLAAILGLVELLRAGGLSDAEQAEFLARVHKETERIHRILRELLDFARQKPSSPELDRSADLVQVVDDAVRLLGPQADARDVRIVRPPHAEVPRVFGGSDELCQVVLNLLLNATDAIAGAGTITIALGANDDGVELVVEDSGPGIPEAVRARLFEPFVTTKPEGKGTGLGLAVCQGIVGRLGGSIDAHDAPSGGARFSVRLRRAHSAP